MQNNDPAMALDLIHFGAELRRGFVQQGSALHLACMNLIPEIVEYILKVGLANRARHRREPSRSARQHTSPQADVLIRQDADQGKGDLCSAYGEGAAAQQSQLLWSDSSGTGCHAEALQGSALLPGVVRELY